ncbi:MAG TPA: cell division protein FtsA, partial [Sideroxyarcus sp.]|nr:cell division protein FtsA [Sideroxyarcus sp.]
MSKNRENKNLIVGLDIGTSKIACIVAEIRPEGTLEVIGAGMHQSSGMKKGMVVNIDATVGAIQRALEEAELMADCKIREVYTGIAGGHIRSSNANGMIKIKDKEVAQTDIVRAVETASSIS